MNSSALYFWKCLLPLFLKGIFFITFSIVFFSKCQHFNNIIFSYVLFPVRNLCSWLALVFCVQSSIFLWMFSIFLCTIGLEQFDYDMPYYSFLLLLFLLFFRFHLTSWTHVGLWFPSGLEIFHPSFSNDFSIHPFMMTSIKCTLGTNIIKMQSRRTRSLFPHKSKQLDIYPWTKTASGGLRSSLKILWQHSSGNNNNKTNKENTKISLRITI